MAHLRAIVLLLVVGLALAGKSTKKSNKYFDPLSDEFINHINSVQSTWKVRYSQMTIIDLIVLTFYFRLAGILVATSP